MGTQLHSKTKVVHYVLANEVSKLMLRFFAEKRRSFLIHKFPSPDSSENPFIQIFRDKRLQRIAGNSSKKINEK